jgi:zinc transport system substrate-binding protein
MILRAVTRTLAAVTVVTGLAACGSGTGGGDPQRVDVVAGFYPLQYVAERVGGDAVRVTNLAKPGAEPHDLELNPRQVGEVIDAELIVYLKGFQPALDEAVKYADGNLPKRGCSRCSTFRWRNPNGPH